MANRLANNVEQIHSMNPMNLVDQLIRTRVFECIYWKDDLFGVSGKLN
jgi:pre-mRNA-splicing factor 38A